MKLTAETTIFNDDKVQQKFSELIVDADGIRTEVSKKVGDDEVISRINQSAESVKIQANKINIDGVITAVNDNTTTTINGDKITTGTLTSDNITVGLSSLTNALNEKAPSGAENTANNYITDIDSKDGITIKAVNGTTDTNATTGNYIKLNASGLNIYKGGQSVAEYGSSERIGKNASRHSEISESGFDVRKDNITTIASVSYGTGAAESGTAKAPYYILGSYLDLSPAPANYSIAGGVYSEALGYCSRAIGYYVKTNYAHQTAIGKFNDNNSNNVFEIGWGTSDSARKNIFAVKADGTAEINGSSMTDFVIEQGDGYRKWNSGIAECWITTTKNVALNTAYGSLYQGSWTWTFPITFNANPAVTCSLFKWGTGASWGAVSAATTTNATLRGIDAISRASGSCAIAAYAIGRWK